MTVRSISIEAYEKHKNSGKQLVQWVLIYDWLRSSSGWTRAEISEHMGIRMSSVCGRVKELLDANLLVEGPRRTCTVTGEAAHPVHRHDQQQQSDLFGHLI